MTDVVAAISCIRHPPPHLLSIAIVHNDSRVSASGRSKTAIEWVISRTSSSAHNDSALASATRRSEATAAAAPGRTAGAVSDVRCSSQMAVDAPMVASVAA